MEVSFPNFPAHAFAADHGHIKRVLEKSDVVALSFIGDLHLPATKVVSAATHLGDDDRHCSELMLVERDGSCRRLR